MVMFLVGFGGFGQSSEKRASEDDIKDYSPEALNDNQQDNFRAVICGISYSGTDCGLSIHAEEETVGEGFHADQARLQIDWILRALLHEMKARVAAIDDGVVQPSKQCHRENVQAEKEEHEVPPTPPEEVICFEAIVGVKLGSCFLLNVPLSSFRDNSVNLLKSEWSSIARIGSCSLFRVKDLFVHGIHA